MFHKLLGLVGFHRQSGSVKTKRRSVHRSALRLEALEKREVCNVDFLSGLALGVDAPSPGIRETAVDAAGNLYIAGTIYGTSGIDFDPGNVRADNSDILFSRGGFDGFVAKYAPDHSLLWVRQMGGATPWNSSNTNLQMQYDRATDLEVDASGNVYVAGEFVRSATFGPYTLSVTTNSDYTDAFITKLDANGNFLWAKSWGNSAQTPVSDIAVEASGNVVIVGYNTFNAEVRKYSPTGSLQWSKTYAQVASGGQSVTPWGTSARSVAIDTGGNILIGGNFTGKVDFNPDTKKTFYVTGSNSKDSNAYVLKLTPAGQFTWVAPMIAKTATANIQGAFVQVDALGRVYLGGSYSGAVDVNPSATIDTRLPEVTLTTGSIAGFVLQLNATGALNWAKSIGEVQSVRDMALDATGVYLVGFIQNTFNAGDGTPVIAAPEKTAGYIVHISSAGVADWVYSLGGVSGHEFIEQIAVASDGTLYVMGSFGSPSLDFDGDPLTSPDLIGRTGTNSSPKFLARLRRS